MTPTLSGGPDKSGQTGQRGQKAPRVVGSATQPHGSPWQLDAPRCSYLGWEFFDLLRAYFKLWEEAAEASTFAELREAGERFGKVIGPNSVRILLLLGTAAVGETAALVCW